MRGASPMWIAPRTAITEKNSTMIGPKKTPTRAVPVRCTKNSVTRMRTVSDCTSGVLSKKGETSFSPSSAESTEIAGVMIASPENSAAPATPKKKTSVERRPSAFLGQRHEGQRTALALVVGAHQEQNVFGRHRVKQRPEQQRHGADHRLVAEAAVLRVSQRLAQRVEGTRSDIAVDDADRRDREPDHGRWFRMRVRMRFGVGGERGVRRERDRRRDHPRIVGGRAAHHVLRHHRFLGGQPRRSIAFFDPITKRADGEKRLRPSRFGARPPSCRRDFPLSTKHPSADRDQHRTKSSQNCSVC